MPATRISADNELSFGEISTILVPLIDAHLNVHGTVSTNILAFARTVFGEEDTNATLADRKAETNVPEMMNGGAGNKGPSMSVARAISGLQKIDEDENAQALEDVVAGYFGRQQIRDDVERVTNGW